MRFDFAKKIKVVAVALASMAGAAFCADISLDVGPLFVGISTPRGLSPYILTAENVGRGTRGAFEVECQGVITRIPVDLPQGSKKQVIVNLEMGYPPPTAKLVTERGTFEAKIPENVGSEAGVLLVSDNVAGLGLRRIQTNPNSGTLENLQEFFVKPEMIPERTASYYGVAAVILADGSERMTDAAFEALLNYLLLGGTVMIPGGAANPLLVDPRWKPYLPVSDTSPVTLTAKRGEKISGLSLNGEFTVRKGRVHPSSMIRAHYRGIPVIVSRGFGAGKVLFTAFNPFERPMDAWSGKGDLLRSLQFARSYRTTASFLSSANIGDQYGNYYSSGSYGGPSPYPSGYRMPGEQSDPFEAKPPDTSSVISILLVYIVLVVPLNLLILRKMGKGEWAWVSTPLISFGFAAIFFRFAAGLYSADMSLMLVGTLVGDERSNSAYFLGNTQMFFPRGGAYDLKMEGVEMASNRNQSYGMERRGTQAIELVDTGQIRVPAMQVTNLAFREFSFGQRLKAGKWLSISRVGPRLRLTNHSPHTMAGLEIRSTKVLGLVGSLGPGESWEGVPVKSRVAADSVAALSTGKNRLKISGTIAGIRPGPQIGKLSGRRTVIRMVYFLDGGDI